MSYVDLDEVKTYLWIELANTEFDSRLNLLIKSTWALLNFLIWDLKEWPHTDQLTICKINWCEIDVKHYNVTVLLSISWESYTGVINEDYRILWPNTLWIKDIYDYEISQDKYFDLEYTAWYADDSDEYALLKQLQLYIIDLEFNGKEAWQLVKQYRLWPRTFTYADTDENAKLVWSIESIINIFTLLPPV